MAGKKGRSGGARPGAGRKPKPEPEVVPVDEDLDMLTFLQEVALGRRKASSLQIRAAICAAQYTHEKADRRGKKARQEDAAQMAMDFFATMPAGDERNVN